MSHRNATALTVRFFVLLVAAAGRVDASDTHIADDDFVMPNIHFGYQIRQGKFAKVKAKVKAASEVKSLEIASICDQYFLCGSLVNVFW